MRVCVVRKPTGAANYIGVAGNRLGIGGRQIDGERGIRECRPCAE